MKGKKNLIKNIIFDLGGVLLDLDLQKTFNAFGKIGLSQEAMMDIYHRKGNFFLQFEKGDISADEFRTTLKEIIGNQTSKEKINFAWNEMLRGFKKYKVKLLSHLSEKYPLYMLSNTNEIHLPFYSEQFRKASGGIDLQEYFIKAYFSHIIRTRKPEPESFRHVLEDACIEPEETLFIDDIEDNCIAATETGMIAHHYNIEEDLGNVLKQYEIIPL